MTSLGVRKRHRRHANPFTVRGAVEVPDWEAVYGRSAPLALDVGFGPGRFIVELAQRHPEWNVLGLEIRQHLVEQARAEAAAAGLKNLHAMLANANLHLEELLPDASLAFVSVNFPDPWYKKRHHKRRVVRPEWLTVLSKKMRPGAELHAMTDYEPVAMQILDTLEAAAGYVNIDGPGGFAIESTTGIVTEREIKHSGRGERIYRLRFRYGLAKSPQIL